ncbi:hypothetical protein J6590_044229 [Homalodisca vitripennis]|nr:hypothetical protein J6590_044229 [Homalodisca vitripennis]
MGEEKTLCNEYDTTLYDITTAQKEACVEQVSEQPRAGGGSPPMVGSETSISLTSDTAGCKDPNCICTNCTPICVLDRTYADNHNPRCLVLINCSNNRADAAVTRTDSDITCACSVCRVIRVLDRTYVADNHNPRHLVLINYSNNRADAAPTWLTKMSSHNKATGPAIYASTDNHNPRRLVLINCSNNTADAAVIRTVSDVCTCDWITSVCSVCRLIRVLDRTYVADNHNPRRLVADAAPTWLTEMSRATTKQHDLLSVLQHGSELPAANWREPLTGAEIEEGITSPNSTPRGNKQVVSYLDHQGIPFPLGTNKGLSRDFPKSQADFPLTVSKHGMFIRSRAGNSRANVQFSQLCLHPPSHYDHSDS